MLSKKVRTAMGFWVAAAVGQSAGAFDCHSYDDVTGKLGKSYKEQLVFSGFADSDDGNGSNAVYELWVNPERGNWSLVAHKVLLFQSDQDVFSKSCAFIVSSGKRHNMLGFQAIPTSDNGAESLFGETADSAPVAPTTMPTGPATAAAETTPGAASAANVNCIPRDRHAAALKERYQEVPVVRALTEDDTVVEVYGGAESWTITQSKIREVRNTATGRPVTDEKTGQKIHQLCSDPAYSGMTWGLFETEQQHI